MTIEGSESEFKSPKEIAELCGLSPRAIYRAIGRGELRANRLCGRLRSRITDIEEWIDRNAVEPAPSLQQPPANGRVGAPGGGSLRRMLRSSESCGRR
jgi:excisionase family DNA binding protein